MITSRRGFLSAIIVALAGRRLLGLTVQSPSRTPTVSLTDNTLHVRLRQVGPKVVNVPFIGPDGRIWQRVFEMPRDQAAFDAFIQRPVTHFGDDPFVKIDTAALRNMASKYRAGLTLWPAAR